MTRVLRQFTILGCASSPGVPRINGDWGACDPANPKNRRTRAAFMIRQIAADGGTTTVVFDTGPDFREQMIANKVSSIDAVLYTHSHADHVHGIDDLRGFALGQRRRIPIHADPETMARIRAGFGYCLQTPADSNYPPIAEAHLITSHDRSLMIDGAGGVIAIEPLDQIHGSIHSLGYRIGDVAYCCDVSDFPPIAEAHLITSHDRPLVIDGAGGAIAVDPLDQIHGSIHSLGYRIGDVAYCCDVSDFPAATARRLEGLDLLIIDALQYKPHPSHLSIDQALWWIDKLSPRRAVLTHMHVPLDYDKVLAETPAHVEPAHDGLTIEYEVEI